MLFDMPVVHVPDAVITERESYYVIHATDEPGIVKAMNENGPADSQSTYWAHTVPAQGFGYDTRQQGAMCVLVKPWVRLAINIVYPSWTPPHHTPPNVITKWNAMIAALRRHEDGHAQFARDAATQLVTLMRSHSSDTTCAKLDTYIQREAAVINQRHEDADRDYDRRTSHGVNDGVAISW